MMLLIFRNLFNIYRERRWPTVVEGDPKDSLFNNYYTEVSERI